MPYDQIIAVASRAQYKSQQTATSRYFRRSIMVLPLVIKGYLPIMELQSIHHELLTNSTLVRDEKVMLVNIFFQLLRQLNRQQRQQLSFELSDMLSAEFFGKINVEMQLKINHEEASWDFSRNLKEQSPNTPLFKALVTKLQLIIVDDPELKYEAEQARNMAIDWAINIDTHSDKLKNTVIGKVIEFFIDMWVWSRIDLKNCYYPSEVYIKHLMQKVGLESFLLSYAAFINNIETKIHELNEALDLTLQQRISLFNLNDKYTTLCSLFDYLFSTFMCLFSVNEVYGAISKLEQTLDPKSPFKLKRTLITTILETAVTVDKSVNQQQSNIELQDKSCQSSIISQILLDEHVFGFNEFYGNFHKINARTNLQHQLQWIDFETQHMGCILMLLSIMGNDVWKFLNGQIIQTCLPLDRLLKNVKIIPQSLIEELTGLYKKNQDKFRKSPKLLMNLIDIIDCIITASNEQDNDQVNTKIADELQTQFDTQEHTNAEVLCESLTSYLIRLIINKDDNNQSGENDDIHRCIEAKKQAELKINFEKLVARVPLHLFVRLIKAKQTMLSSPYINIFFEMIKSDIALSNTTVWDLCHHDEQPFEQGKELAKHNNRIKSRLSSKAINCALDYSRTLDVIIDTGAQSAVDIEQHYQVLYSYLQQAIAAAERIFTGERAQSFNINYQKLKKRWSELASGVAKRGIRELSKPHAIGPLKIINNSLNEIRNILDANVEIHKPFLEFSRHFDEHLTVTTRLTDNFASVSTKKQLSTHSFKIRVRQWNKNDPRTFFLGDFVGCCLASDADQFAALVQRRMDDGMQFFVATDIAKDRVIALFWMYFAEDAEGNIYLVMNFPEVIARFGQLEELRRAILASLLQFTERYLQDNPGFSGFFMSPLSYGWNQNDLNNFPKQLMPAGFDKLEGPFMPGFSREDILEEDAETIRRFTQEYYYLSSLSVEEFHRYSMQQRKLLTTAASVRTKEQIAQDTMTEFAINKLEDYESQSRSRYDLERLKFVIARHGLVDAIWDDMSIVVETQLYAMIGEFFSSRMAFVSFIAEQRSQCKLSKYFRQQGLEYPASTSLYIEQRLSTLYRPTFFSQVRFTLSDTDDEMPSYSYTTNNSM